MHSVRKTFAALAVDDDPNLLRLATEVLRAEGCDVRTADCGRDGIAAFGQQPAALVLLDMTLPDMEGPEICRQLRELPGGAEAFVLILSGRRELADRLAGFHAGADDYVTKPLDTYELSLRVRAILRRSAPTESAPTEVVFGRWRLEIGQRTLITPERPIQLTPAEFQLLHHLMRHPQTLWSSEMLLQAVWQYPPGTGSPDLIRFHVRNLRKKVEADPEHPELLVSVPHHGYMLKMP